MGKHRCLIFFNYVKCTYNTSRIWEKFETQIKVAARREKERKREKKFPLFSIYI